MRAFGVAILICGALFLLAGCGSSSDSATTSAKAPEREVQVAVDRVTEVEGPAPEIETPGGAPPAKLGVTDLVKGTGVPAKPGDELTIQFASIRYTTGERFESSWEGGKTFTFTLDSDSVSPGWVKGLPGMRVGGRRELVVPTKMTSRFGVPPGTGPEAALIYVIDLLEARPAGATTQANTDERAKPKIFLPKRPPPKNLVVKEIEAGAGPVAKDGDKLTLQYVVVFYANGKPLSPGSWGYGRPRSFILGAGDESPGWERGLKGMRVGGRRELIVPTRLTTPYGVAPGTGSEATLFYVVDLIDID